MRLRRSNPLLVVVAAFALAFLVGPAGAQEAPQDVPADSSSIAAVDSLLQSFSPEELIRYREYYQRELDKLQTEIRKLRERGYAGCLAIECGGRGTDRAGDRRSDERG